MDLDAPLGAQPSSDQSEGPTTLKALLGSQAGVKFFKEFLVSRSVEMEGPGRDALGWV